MWLDLKSLDGFIHHPVFVLKPPMLVAGFLRPIDTGIEIVTSPTFLVGDKGADFLGAGFIRIHSDVPALHRLAGIGLFVEPSQPLFLIEPGIHGGFTGFYCYIMGAKLRKP